MTTSGGRLRRAALALLALGVVLAPALPAAAADDAHTYPGPNYSGAMPINPTASESQSKLWFHADAWWALLVEPLARTARVYELMPDHSWRPTQAVVNTDVTQVGDALRDGDFVHVVSRVSTGDLQYVRLVFDANAGEYRAESPALVTTRGANAPASIAKDSSGRLWVGYANALEAAVAHSVDGRVWSERIRIASTAGDTPEVAALIAYDDRVGLLWSQQSTDSFEFASHRNGDPAEIWAREKALEGATGADDQISVVRVPGERSDTLIAAVQTAGVDPTADPDDPLITLLVRNADGTWTNQPVATVEDQLTDPLLQLDLTNRTLHLLASSESGDIVAKRASLDDLRFKGGLGNTFLQGAEGRMQDPSGTKEPIDPRSGLVVLATDASGLTYRHAEAPVSGAPPPPTTEDRTPPSPPDNVRGWAVSPEASVLSWNQGNEENRWTPADTGVPVREYVVTRNGTEIASVTGTSLRDAPRSGPANEQVSVEYLVQAVDQAGNRSEPVRIMVVLPPEPSRLPLYLGAGILAVALLAAAYGLHHLRRVRRRMAAGYPAVPATTPEERVRVSSGTPAP